MFRIALVNLLLGLALAPGGMARDLPVPVITAPPEPHAVHQGMFLVAKRDMPDPRFRETVIYLAQHGDDGTLGFVVNRRTSFTLGDAVEGIDGPEGEAHRLYAGGPVGLDRVMFLARAASVPLRAVRVDDGLYLAAERDALESLLTAGASPSDLRLYIGYAGWSAGQLAGELRRGDWFQVAGDQDLIFASEPEAVWRRLIDKYEPRGQFVEAPPHGPSWTPAHGVEAPLRAGLVLPSPFHAM